MEQHLSFSKIYIFRFTDFNGMLNKNAKQNIVNSMWREDLNGCTIQDLWQTYSWTYRNIHSKTPVLDSRFNKVEDLQACNFIEMRI